MWPNREPYHWSGVLSGSVVGIQGGEAMRKQDLTPGDKVLVMGRSYQYRPVATFVRHIGPENPNVGIFSVVDAYPPYNRGEEGLCYVEVRPLPE